MRIIAVYIAIAVTYVVFGNTLVARLGDAADPSSALRGFADLAFVVLSALLLAYFFRRHKSKQPAFIGQLDALQSANPIFLTDRQGVVQWCNEAYLALCGQSRGELIGTIPLASNSERLEADFYAGLWRAADKGEVWHGEVSIHDGESGHHHLIQTITPIHDAEGRISHYLAVHDGDTQEADSDDDTHEITNMAHYDALTGLPNRVLFKDRMAQAIARARRSSSMMSVMFIDLDRFKDVNDTLGHEIGDKLLQTAGKRLLHAVRDSDTVARLGGDEFAVILEGLADAGLTEVVAQKITTAFSKSFQLDEYQVDCGLSLGASIYPLDADNPEDLLRFADLAMYAVKEGGRNGYKLYSADMNKEVEERVQLARELYDALEANHLYLDYQPQMDLHTGEVRCAEALLRWKHPERGMISPADFIPAAESAGLMGRLGEWVLRQCCLQVAAWNKAGVPPVVVAANLSAHQLRSNNLVTTMKTLLEETGADGHQIELELSETDAMARADDVAEQFDQLTELGIGVSIDNFGTGYSSLTYLQKFPIRKIKIDGCFISDILEKGDDNAIVRAVIALAKTMGLKVLAEGVETQVQLDFLRKENCDMYQGYLFSRPISPEELAELAKRPPLTTDQGAGQDAVDN
ncbi:MAG: EAL domain-containing protein [Rhodospirillaceae bacterium]|nr:EAL domain-containing protein [Rhodospirillaceae bacterium]MBT5751476.1 EAL domain-containing protein [Rhodospirillaceae bacterium]